MTIPAKYENGVFKPLEAVSIQEGTVVEVYVAQPEIAKPRSIGDLGFAGMWADRDDITDGVSYARSRSMTRSAGAPMTCSRNMPNPMASGHSTP